MLLIIDEPQMASNDMAESKERPQPLSHPDQNSSDGRGGEVVSLAYNSLKITLHGFEPTIQPKTLNANGLRYSGVALHYVLGFTLM
jgi:hypothetical protein